MLQIHALPSPNFDERRNGVSPTFLILHYTGTQSAEEARDRYLSDDPALPGGRISPHYMIDEEGTVFSFVPEGKRAWHAGVSFWKKQTDINSLSIGIELVNPGHEGTYRPFSQAQMQALIPLCQDIVRRYDIPSSQILAHSDVSPTRRSDPGELFDWKRMAKNGLGLWPEPDPEDFNAGKVFLENEHALKKALESFGYAPEAPLPDLIRAFRMHFYPESFASPEKSQPDATFCARLACLLRSETSIA